MVSTRLETCEYPKNRDLALYRMQPSRWAARQTFASARPVRPLLRPLDALHALHPLQPGSSQLDGLVPVGLSGLINRRILMLDWACRKEISPGTYTNTAKCCSPGAQRRSKRSDAANSHKSDGRPQWHRPSSYPHAEGRSCRLPPPSFAATIPLTRRRCAPIGYWPSAVNSRHDPLCRRDGARDGGLKCRRPPRFKLRQLTSGQYRRGDQQYALAAFVHDESLALSLFVRHSVIAA